MGIEITCIGCGKVLHVPDAAAGKKGKCPHCGAILQVPEVEQQAFTEADLKFQPPSEPPPPTHARDGTKACPYCGEEIKAAAIVCRFCGMNLISGETTRGQAGVPTSQPLVGAAQVPEKTLWKANPTNWSYLGQYVISALLIPVLIGIPLLIWAILDRKYTVYTVSNKRVIQKRGIIGKALSEIDLKDIRNVLVEYGIIGRLLGFGNVGLATAATAGVEIQMKGCKDPEHVRRLVVDAKERAQKMSYRVE